MASNSASTAIDSPDLSDPTIPVEKAKFYTVNFDTRNHGEIASKKAKVGNSVTLPMTGVDYPDHRLVGWSDVLGTNTEMLSHLVSNPFSPNPAPTVDGTTSSSSRRINTVSRLIARSCCKACSAPAKRARLT